MHAGGEVRGSVVGNVDVQVKFDESVSLVATSEHDSLCAYHVLIVTLNPNRCIVRLVSSQQITAASVLEDKLVVRTHLGSHHVGTRRTLQVVLRSPLTVVVIRRSHVLGDVSASSGDVHSVEEGEGARVGRGVDDVDVRA